MTLLQFQIQDIHSPKKQNSKYERELWQISTKTQIKMVFLGNRAALLNTCYKRELSLMELKSPKSVCQ